MTGGFPGQLGLVSISIVEENYRKVSIRHYEKLSCYPAGALDHPGT
jgi:hypothetical protein